jgi:uncharacterized phage infection (PIP) family protein YhgE
MSESGHASFAYETLDAQIRAQIEQATADLHYSLKRTTEHMLCIGQKLKEVKDALPYGQFLLWLEAEFEMSYRTAYRFIQVAEQLADRFDNLSNLSAHLLYELATPSTSDTIIEGIETGAIAPTIAAIKAAKAAERQAHLEAEAAQQALAQAHDTLQTQQAALVLLTNETARLQEQIALLSSQAVQIQEMEKQVVPPELTAQLQQLQQQVRELTSERERLVEQVQHLGDEARASYLKQQESEPERRIRLNWYALTNEYRRTYQTLTAKWPSPLDTLAFEAEDWTRLSQLQKQARRLSEACTELRESRVINSSSE